MEITVIPVGILRTNCYIVSSEQKKAVVIDPGDDEGRLVNRITNLGLSIPYILLTHGHFDHVGAVKAVQKRFGSKLCVGAPDAELLLDPTLVTNRVRAQFEERHHLKPDLLLEEGQEITVDELCFRVLMTPGHTRGGVSYLCGKALFTGDTLFKSECGRTDLYGGSYEAILASLLRLGSLPGDYAVLPGHDEATTMEAERRNNPYMREALRRAGKASC